MKHFGLFVDIAERVRVVKGAAAEKKGERRLGLKNLYSSGTRAMLNKYRSHIGGHLN
jgi:hypothetical protein